MNVVYYTTGFTMSELKQQQHKDVKKLRPDTRKVPWMFIIMAIISVFVATRAFGVLAKKHQANKMNRAYQTEILELAQKEKDMHQELTQLATEDGLEQEIREKFRVTKEGEELIVIVPLKDTADKNASSGGLFSFLRKLFK